MGSNTDIAAQYFTKIPEQIPISQRKILDHRGRLHGRICRVSKHLLLLS